MHIYKPRPVFSSSFQQLFLSLLTTLSSLSVLSRHSFSIFFYDLLSKSLLLLIYFLTTIKKRKLNLSFTQRTKETYLPLAASWIGGDGTDSCAMDSCCWAVEFVCPLVLCVGDELRLLVWESIPVVVRFLQVAGLLTVCTVLIDCTCVTVLCFWSMVSDRLCRWAFDSVLDSGGFGVWNRLDWRLLVSFLVVYQWHVGCKSWLCVGVGIVMLVMSKLVLVLMWFGICFCVVLCCVEKLCIYVVLRCKLCWVFCEFLCAGSSELPPLCVIPCWFL